VFLFSYLAIKMARQCILFIRFSKGSADDEICEFSSEIEKVIAIPFHGIAHFAVPVRRQPCALR
jgi:hypothetical protein